MIAALTQFVLVISALLLLVRIYKLLTSARCFSKVCLVGKTALVTGGSSGIGYEIVLDLASRGCKVIIADKNVNEEIRNALVRKTYNPNIRLEYVDLASFSSVRDLVERLKKTENKLDILVNNAGVGKAKGRTKDGVNFTWQVNYFSGFLLTHLLVDLLKNSSSGRIIFTSSGLSHLHDLSESDVKNGKFEDKASVFEYANSKFMCIVASDIFAGRLKKFNITCNSYHPGVVNTPIFNQTAKNIEGLLELFYLWSLRFLLMGLGKSPEEGAQTAIHLAVSQDMEGVTGRFFGETKPTLKPRGSNNQQLCERIWLASELTVKLMSEEKL